MKNVPLESGANGPGTVVGVNVALTGTLKDQNDISIYGMVDGEVISEKSVAVGQSAQVKGPVRGQVVTVAGVIRGSIEAGTKLEVLETGKIFGAIDARDLVVHSGAIIIGKISMIDPSTPETDNQVEKLEDNEQVEEKSNLELKPDEE